MIVYNESCNTFGNLLVLHVYTIVNKNKNLLNFIMFIYLIANIVLYMDMFIYLFIVWHHYTKQLNT